MMLARCSLLVFLVACAFPTRSERYACQTTADCDQGRTCDEYGYCVVAATDAGAGSDGSGGGGGGSDAAVTPDADLLAMKCPTAGYALVTGPNGYYKIVANGASWTTAQAACAADVAGSSHLIVLSSTAEVTYASAHLGWVGLSDRAVENQFANVTTEPGDLRPWANGQPDNGGGTEDCAQMKAGGLLDDDQCGNAHPYVCECDGRMSTP